MVCLWTPPTADEMLAARRHLSHAWIVANTIQRQVGMAGFLAALLLPASVVAGVWAAASLDVPTWIGWIGGAIVGFFCSRALFRAVLTRD